MLEDLILFARRLTTSARHGPLDPVHSWNMHHSDQLLRVIFADQKYDHCIPTEKLFLAQFTSASAGLSITSTSAGHN